MLLPDDGANRHVIPRWRDSRTTAELGELDSLQPRSTEEKSVDDSRAANAVLVARKEADWLAHRSVSFASDLLATVMSSGTESASALEAADFLIGNAAASPSAKAIARRLLGYSTPEIHPTAGGLTLDRRRERIHALRERLKDGPRNSLARVDLALEYTALGFRQQALAAMEVALRLAPNHRFLLRSASRLLIHVGDPATALDILRQSHRSKHDPWLVAAEIAIAGLAGKESRLAKVGAQLLSGGHFSPLHTTELASALATLEAESGARKRARGLFRQSLVEPTENVVAQAEWASRRLGFDEFQAKWLEVPGSFEARALNNSGTGHLVEAAAETWKWLDDQAFSTTAAIFGSFITSVGLEDYEQSLRFVEAGQRANPHDWLLLNNKAFALANLGELDEAEALWRPISRVSADRRRTATLRATGGLLLYRRGLAGAGRELYRNAVELFEKDGATRAAALAAILHAREELSTGDRDSLDVAVDRARRLSKGITTSEIVINLERLENLLRDRPEPPSRNGTPVQRTM